ncbi:6856_t:CDS:1, partial [Paraglomus occultum]
DHRWGCVQYLNSSSDLDVVEVGWGIPFYGEYLFMGNKIEN